MAGDTADGDATSGRSLKEALKARTLGISLTKVSLMPNSRRQRMPR
jgi:hypothetical protein